MRLDARTLARRANWARYRPGQRTGHYESFFLRANHPSRPLAFWIRYTLVSPAGRPADALGELWAIWFDGETGQHVAVKKEVPIAGARFEREGFRVDVDGATVSPGRARGSIGPVSHGIGWDLSFRSAEAPLFLFPPMLYRLPLPKAKSLVPAPLATFTGELEVLGEKHDVAGWVGSQNHNWGAKHTDQYAWGQVAGFDGHPASFLEMGTGRLKIGPVWTPLLTMIVLRHEGEEIALQTPAEALRAQASIGGQDPFRWSFVSERPGVRVEGTFSAEAADFVGLWYMNPPGGKKRCYNSKIATCELTVTRGGRVEKLRAQRRAAFEILTDEELPGPAMRA